MKGSKIFLLYYTSSFSFITCPPIGGLTRLIATAHGFRSDEEVDFPPLRIDDEFSSSYDFVPVLHEDDTRLWRNPWSEAATLAPPGTEVSKPSLDISRGFGLLDQTNTTKPKLKNSISISRTTSKVESDKRVKKVEKLLDLAPIVSRRTNNQRFENLAESIHVQGYIKNLIHKKPTNRPSGSHRSFWSPPNAGLSTSQQNIKMILEVLEEDHLEMRERVWLLALLKTIQQFLLPEDETLLHTSFQDGSLCRGELELLLTQNENLVACAMKLWNQDPVDVKADPGILESLERVELFLKIYEHLKITGSDKQSPEFIKIYDTLLQACNPIPKEILLDLITKSQLHMVNETIQESEIISIYHIITHLQKHYKEVIENLVDKTMINPIFESMYASLKKDFEYQERVKLDVKAFFARENGDLHMENLVAPFIGLSKVDLKHYDYVLTSLKAYEDKVRKLDPQDPRKTNRYMKNQKEVLGILSKASEYIEGAKELMNQETPKLANHSDDIECGSKQVLQIEDESEEEGERCPICLHGFLNGEHLLKLDCSESHLFHKDCIQKHIDESQYLRLGKPSCPMCRSEIQTPIPRRGHIFGYNKQTTLNPEKPITPDNMEQDTKDQ